MRYQGHVLSLALTIATAKAFNFEAPAPSCQTLQENWTSNTYFPNDTLYMDLNTDFFTAKSWLGPACIFAPTSAEEMSAAVKLFKQNSTPFAVRGGGHMPIGDSNNIDASGILLASSGLTQLALSEDGLTVEVGPGNRWAAVYEYLEPHKLVTVGGRMGVVGVPGFLLGGGISFFGNVHGWGSANVVQYDCVLANGDIVSATPDNDYADLFWALRGGGNSFAIVTGFHLKTIPLPSVALGESVYGPGVGTEFLDYVHDFAVNGANDPKAAVIPIVRWGAGEAEPTYHSVLFYNGNTTSAPALSNFTRALTPNATTFRVRESMFNWTAEADAPFSVVHGMSNRFWITSIRADREAMQIIHDGFFDAARAQLNDVENFYAGVAFMPLAERFFTASVVNGGDPMGVDPSQAPYIWVEQSLMWSSSEDDETIEGFLASVNGDIAERLGALERDVSAPFMYLNDADAKQRVFEGYPKGSVMLLNLVRDKYDPEGVFTELMPGGWKVAKAYSGEDEA